MHTITLSGRATDFYVVKMVSLIQPKEGRLKSAAPLAKLRICVLAAGIMVALTD